LAGQVVHGALPLTEYVPAAHAVAAVHAPVLQSFVLQSEMSAMHVVHVLAGRGSPPFA
jgi:hypothetical protein